MAGSAGHADLGGLAAAILGRPEGEANAKSDVLDAGTEDVAAWSPADSIPPGSAAVVALIEHTWALPLTAAIKWAGGSRREETWLASGDRLPGTKHASAR